MYVNYLCTMDPDETQNELCDVPECPPHPRDWISEADELSFKVAAGLMCKCMDQFEDDESHLPPAPHARALERRDLRQGMGRPPLLRRGWRPARAAVQRLPAGGAL